MDPLFEIQINPAARGSRDIARSLYRQLLAAIVDGRLPLGARLPPTRNAQAFFGVARNTVAEVYEQLMNEGYVVARHGSGTFVAPSLPAAPVRATTRTKSPHAHRVNSFWLRPDVAAAMSFWRDRPEDAAPQQVKAKAAAIDLRPALVDSRLFPHDVFRRVTAQQLRTLERKPASYKSPQGNQGNYRLREAVARHIALTRAVVCAGDDVLVTSGAQQAFDLLARVLVVAGETTVAVEDPGYPPMRVAFAAAGAKLVPVGVDAEGLIVERIPKSTGVICLTPSHQFPLGVTLSARRREELIAFARKYGAVIVEDDYDGEFRFDGNPLAALRTPEAADVVFYVGTFSKCMLPALRLGFVVAPDWAMRTLTAAKNCMDWHCSAPLQLGVAAFIAEGHLAHHVRKMRNVYKARRQLLQKLLHAEFDSWLEPIPSTYGMHVGAYLRASRKVDLDRATEELLRHDVKIHSFARYYLGDKTRDGLIFGYGVAEARSISAGLGRLKTLLG